MKKIYFHIGYHRTGTTYFQTSVSKRREQLAARGCLVPTTGYDGVTHSPLALCLPSDRAAMNQRMRSSAGIEYDIDPYTGPPADALYRDLAAELRNSSADIALVTSECFLEWLNVECLRGQLQANNIDAEFIVFLRRQDRWIESVFSQVVRDPYLAYAGSFDDLPQIGQLDFNSELGKWMGCFGADRIHTRFYEEGAAPETTTREMLTIMGLRHDLIDRSESPESSPYRNASLDECCVEVLRSLNKRRLADKSVWRMIHQLSADLKHQGRFRNWRLPIPKASELLRKYDASNAALFERLGIKPDSNWGVISESKYSEYRQRLGKYKYLFARLRPNLGRRNCAAIAWDLARSK